jgi:uncharacterized membrane protein YfcA
MRGSPIFLLVALAVMAGVAPAPAFAAETAAFDLPWWGWALLLFVVSFALGIVAVLGGIGGGVLFVPVVGGLFPFHIDFVRGAGLLVALAGALAAGPGLLRSGMANLRLALPLGLIASIAAVFGASVGLALPAQWIEFALGGTILGIVVLMFLGRKSELPDVPQADRLSTALRISGVFHDPYRQTDIDWKIHRTPAGLVLFAGIGMLAGMFGLGAGWANVPVLNLVLGAPLKVSVATSKFMLSIVDTAAAWVYINAGAVLALVAVPSIVGIMLGSVIGVRLLARTRASVIRVVVIVLLLAAGTRAVLKGFGI